MITVSTSVGAEPIGTGAVVVTVVVTVVAGVALAMHEVIGALAPGPETGA